MNMLLEVKNITVHYGKSIALDDVSLEVAEGSVVSIIGANGAGKSTTLKAISGLVPLISGQILFQNKRIDGMEIPEIVKLGIVYIPEDRWLFPYLTVLDNLLLGASLQKEREKKNRDLEDIFERFPVLRSRRDQNAGTLSGGEQQMLAIARGLMANPKLLLMDEPSLGLAPIVVENLGGVIKDINRTGVSVLLVEQRIPLALGVATRGYALQIGRVIIKGDIEEIKSSDIVKKVYL
jgi:branched-chain amino acid transport system ATP-binding protein